MLKTSRGGKVTTKKREFINKRFKVETLSDLQALPHGNALLSTLEIWAERNTKYGNKWKDNKEYQMMGLVAEKFKRLENQFETPSQNNYETKEDTLIDIVNWALFYLQNLQDGKYNENRNN